MDEDGSGYLDQEEINIVLKMMGKRLNKKELKAAFEEYDTDGSGAIDAVELGRLCVELCCPMNDDELAKLVAKLDSDGSGLIEARGRARRRAAERASLTRARARA